VRPRKIIISGGGTGGHIFPAIAIADALKKLDPETKILFVGALGRMEMEKVPAAGYRIVGLDIRGIQRKSILRNLLLPLKVFKSVRKALGIIKEFKPDAVVGVGGYASGPILFAASVKQIRTPELLING
jgi:UDP-N-acetylglucosamine--N-acetylmuramyl-(pentapeptide) pyrophosphoryl-undecaprenol N-acetylglucosamine transferase